MIHIYYTSNVLSLFDAKRQLGADSFVDPDFPSLKRAAHCAYRMGDDPGAECVWPETGPQLHHATGQCFAALILILLPSIFNMF